MIRLCEKISVEVERTEQGLLDQIKFAKDTLHSSKDSDFITEKDIAGFLGGIEKLAKELGYSEVEKQASELAAICNQGKFFDQQERGI